MTDISSDSFKIMYRNKAKLHSKLSLIKDSEQENIITTKETLVSSLVCYHTTLPPTTSTTSQDQHQVMQTNTYTTGETKNSVFDIFKEIKVRNEALKINTYNQFWKRTSNFGSGLLVLKASCSQPFIQRKVKCKWNSSKHRFPSPRQH